MTASHLENIDSGTDEVTEITDGLGHLAAAIPTDTSSIAGPLENYRSKLQQFASLGLKTGSSGLWDLSNILIDGLDELIVESRKLTTAEFQFLNKLPQLLADLVLFPESRIAGRVLLNYLKRPEWVKPLSDADEKLLTGVIFPDVVTKKVVDNNIPEVTEAISLDDIDMSPLSEMAAGEMNDDADLTAAISLDDIDMSPPSEMAAGEMNDDADLTTAISLDDIDMSPPSEVAAGEVNDDVDLTTAISLDDIDMSPPSEVAAGEMNDDVDLTAVISLDDIDMSPPLDMAAGEINDDVDLTTAISLDDIDMSPSLDMADGEINDDVDLTTSTSLDDIDMPQPLEIADNQISHNIESEVTGDVDNSLVAETSITDIDESEISLSELSDSESQPVAESNEASEAISQAHLELLDLVCLELDEIIAEKGDYFKLQSANTDVELYQHQLKNNSEQAENISNAVDLIGLEGLAHVCRLISNHISTLSDNGKYLDDKQFKLVTDWPVLIQGYIKNIFVQSFTDSLIEFLKLDGWFGSLEDDEWVDLERKLRNPSFIEEEKEQRQQLATADDVSIELPEDVNHELLEGLLQDLPGQTEEFSHALQNMAEGQLEALDSAQRIAHTLKGAANVVGISGIANLTHHLEDILEALSKAEKLPTAQLHDDLVEAADCLEAMSEALLGIDQAPDNAVEVLQAILDWANRLDNDGFLDSYAVSLENFEALTTLSAKSVTSTTSNNESTLNESVAAESMLRIPSSLADELLRLAGESMISTVQVQEHIKNSMARQEALHQHNLALEELSADLEHLIDVQGITSNINQEMNEEFDPLEMDQYHELHSVSRRLIEIAADSTQHSNVIEMELNELRNLVIAHDQLQKENQELVLRTRMVLVSTIIPRLKRGVRQACRVTGKKVDLFVEDNDTRMDSEVLNGLIEPLMHILRNAVDHGIETTDERLSSGKPSTGVIRLSFSRKGDHIQISIKDDGRGLDNNKIYKKALQSQLISDDHSVSDDEVKRLILEPGFSTREGVTQVSGRGIGLDVVNVKIRELKGSILIESQPGQGCVFDLTLPVSSFSTHSLMVRAQQHIYAVSSRGIDEILYPGAGDFFEHDGVTYFKIGAQSYKTVILDELLNLNEDRRTIDRENRPILLVRDESGNKVAVLVQDVMDSYNVVVKPMGKYLPQVSGIVGATILGDGSVASVVDLPELLHTASRYKHSRSTRQEIPVIHEVAQKLPHILVVDDSLSARRSLAQFVEDMGFEVRTARDGMEATSLIDVYKPDLMLVDMEMPKMNGLELTSHIRASSELKDIPVIMITSRSTDKHRNAAYDKGVNHFMVKPFAEEELADLINTELGAVAI